MHDNLNMEMILMDRLFRYENFGIKIIKFGVKMRKLWLKQGLGTNLQIFFKKPGVRLENNRTNT